MNFIEKMKEKAKQDLKTIILPESEDVRILKATEQILKEGFANIILLGNEEDIWKLCNQNNINIKGAEIVNPKKSEKINIYVENLYNLRKEKGMTLEKAKDLLFENSRYFATMMVKLGDADGYVSGASHPTADTLKPVLQIIKGAPGVSTISAFFIMVLKDTEYGEDGVFIFSDCGMVENPTAEQLSDIAISSSKSFKELINEEGIPKIAMLSYSTKGSANSELTQKVIQATNLAKEKINNSNLNKETILIDGELQLDAAIVPEVGMSKAPESKVAGKANILIFPDLNAGNIGYKLVQRFAHAEAYGPLCQGLDKPVNDLSRGCSIEDIVGVVAITAVQAQKSKK